MNLGFGEITYVRYLHSEYFAEASYTLSPTRPVSLSYTGTMDSFALGMRRR